MSDVDSVVIVRKMARDAPSVLLLFDEPEAETWATTRRRSDAKKRNLERCKQDAKKIFDLLLNHLPDATLNALIDRCIAWDRKWREKP